MLLYAMPHTTIVVECLLRVRLVQKDQITQRRQRMYGYVAVAQYALVHQGRNYA
jgi:hypothetical protein